MISSWYQFYLVCHSHVHSFNICGANYSIFYTYSVHLLQIIHVHVTYLKVTCSYHVTTKR